MSCSLPLALFLSLTDLSARFSCLFSLSGCSPKIVCVLEKEALSLSTKRSIVVGLM